MQYLASVLSFAAVVVGVCGNTWDSKRRRVTKVGWVALLVGVLSMVATIAGSYRDQRDLDWQGRQREKVRRIAQMDLRAALMRALDPFYTVLQGASLEAGTWFDDRRFYRDADFMVAALADPNFVKSWASVKLEKKSVGRVKLGKSLAATFAGSIAAADSQLNATIAKYAAYLDAEDLLMVHELQMDRFYTVLLDFLPILMKDESYQGHLSMAFPFHLGYVDEEEYSRFLEKIGKLMRTLPPPSL